MDVKLRIVDRPSTSCRNSLYVSNQAPLLPSPFVRLPLGSIKAAGWIQRQLQLMAEGWSPRMLQLSPYLRANSAWFGGDNQGWEAPAYWLRGFYDLAVLLDDEELHAEAQRWIEGVIASQDKDGYFGEPASKRVVMNAAGRDSRKCLAPHGDARCADIAL